MTITSIPARPAAVLFCLLVLCTATAFGQQGDIGAHDPVIMKENDTYYVYTTGRGIPMKSSTDLINWENIGRVFEEDAPAWAIALVPRTRNPWAPDISFFDGEYHLYYSISSFGSQRSCIGLATNKTLNPASPDYNWVDHGLVLDSVPNRDDFNAIDPNIILDENGVPWINWGSFWNGIMLRRLDPLTGMQSPEDTNTYRLATRPIESERAIEASFIIRKNGYYYLFVSHDRCCRGANSTYNIVVGRSKAVTGPYLDADGVSLANNGGTTVIEGYGDVRGPGHNAVLQEDGKDYLVHHYYDASDDGRSKLQIRLMTWGENGFPTAGKSLTGD